MRVEPIVWTDLFAVLLVVYFSATFIQLCYYSLIFSRIAFSRRKMSSAVQQPVSIIICARNEYQNLKKNLPLILEQEYPDFEVVVVNDCSEDDTQYLLKDFADKFPRLKVVTLHENVNFFKGKKFPLSVGIKSAKNEWLLLTDADCRPAGPHWLATMQQAFTEKTAVVLGYGAYETRKGLLNKLIRFDTVMTAMQYFSYALCRMPYMGVGRNLAYRKSLFHSVKGFSSHYTHPYGDDDLFVNSAATGKNTAVVVHPQAFTYSQPKTRWSHWIQQKKRHLTTSGYYKRKHKFLLGLYHLSQMIFYLSLAILLAFLYQWILVLAAWLLRFILKSLVIKKTQSKLQERNLFLFSPLFDVFFAFFNPIIALSNTFSKPHKWK